MEVKYRARAEKIVTGSIGKQMRMTIDHAAEGHCVVRMPTDGSVQNGAGRVHGGAPRPSVTVGGCCGRLVGLDCFLINY